VGLDFFYSLNSRSKIDDMKNNDISLMDKADDLSLMKDLTACTVELKERGYKEDFRVEKDGLRTYENDAKVYKPDEVKITNFYRFEGVSDPGDMTVLYVIETSDGVKGTLSDGYGPYASEEVSKFIVQVQEIQKQIPLKDA
jgi:hypothetical protein